MQQNPGFAVQRQASLNALDDREIDAPIIGLVRAFNRLPYCFTMQSCYGHFMWSRHQSPYNLDPLPAEFLDEPLKYRVAYLALCLDNNERGRTLLRCLNLAVRIDPEYVQFGSAGWFWSTQLNSYVLQVQPIRFQFNDETTVADEEARHLERVRRRLLEALRRVVAGFARSFAAAEASEKAVGTGTE